MQVWNRGQRKERLPESWQWL